MVRAKLHVHGKNAKTGIFVNTPRHLVKGRGNGSTAFNERNIVISLDTHDV